MSNDVGTVMRSCGNPLCTNQLDIVAVLDGKVQPEGWIRTRLVSYLCPTHATGDHVPDWRMPGLADVAIPTCTCGWEGDPHPNLAGAITQWETHIKEAECRRT